MTATAPQENVIGEKFFAPEDQELFARLSLDRNPMHMDPVAARRLMTGTQVVHGVHLLLTALEYCSHTGMREPGSIRCSFNNPVGVGDRVRFALSRNDASGVQIDASVNGMLCCQATIATAQSGAMASAPTLTATSGTDADSASWSRLATPSDEAPQAHLGRRYPIALNDRDFAASFPRCVASLGQEPVAAIASLSYMVGMVCPGLHSVFSSLRLELRRGAQATNTLAFTIDKYDNRVHLFDISFAGCIAGSLKAFRRPPPQRQASLAELSVQVKAGEFGASRALVIGGSRGLGELTARMLAAGGGSVVVSYASGRADAQALCAEINAAAAGRCEALKIDLLHDRFETLALDWSRFDVVYFFPTPRIFRKKTGLFDAPLFAEFVHFYIDKFFELCTLLEAHPRTEKAKVFLPSTVFLTERPKGMTEYVMAKAAAEILVEDINRSFRNLTVVATRLPRLSTDQTASILKLATDSNVDTLLPLLRALHACASAD